MGGRGHNRRTWPQQEDMVAEGGRGHNGGAWPQREGVVAEGGHGVWRGKVAVHIASLLRKQGVNRKWGQAVKPQGPPQWLTSPSKVPSFKGSTAFQNSITSQRASAHTREPMGNRAHLNHNRFFRAFSGHCNILTEYATICWN